MKIKNTRLVSTQMQGEVGNSLKEKLGLGRGIVYGAQTGESIWTVIAKDGIEDGHKLVTQRGIAVYIHQQTGSAKFDKNTDETYKGELWYDQELMEDFEDADEKELSSMMNKYFDIIMNEELVDKFKEEEEEPEEEKEEETKPPTEAKDIGFIDLDEVGFEEWVAKEYQIEKPVLTGNKIANFIWLWEQFKSQTFSGSDKEVSRPKRIT